MTTNYERIKQMSVEEMMKWLGCKTCIYHDQDCFGDGEEACYEGIKQWLESEAEDE